MNSVWKATSTIKKFEPLKGDIKTDVLIIGGGIAGVLCAYMLQNTGIRYALIEADRICGSVTENTTAKITSQHSLIYDKLIRQFGTEKAKLYYEANEEAIKKYRNLSKNIDCDFENKNSYVYSINNLDKLEKEMIALEKIGCKAELLNSNPLPFKTVGAVRFKNQAQFNPLKFISCIADGLNIYEKTTALSYDGKNIITNGGKITASKIIVATHFPIFNKHGLYPLKMYQHRSYVLALENAPDFEGMYVDEAENGMSFRNYKNLLLIGGGDHRTGKEGGNFRELENFYKTYYPTAREKYRWATQDCMTLDSVPYIGEYSKGTTNFYVATGFNKWGMTSSMVAASLLCDKILEKENKYSSLFSPSRSILRPQLFINAFETCKNLLTLTKPRCPHLGCALKWNPIEHSWDCPCHGSRFDKNGSLLEGPSTGNLKSR